MADAGKRRTDDGNKGTNRVGGRALVKFSSH